MAEGLRSIDQIQPGFLWNFPRLRDELNWERWYNGQFDSSVSAGHHRQRAEPAGVGRHHQDQHAEGVLQVLRGRHLV